MICRNVFIYFSLEGIHRAMAGFRECLADDGVVALGPAECAIGEAAGYRRRLHHGQLFYQRCQLGAAETMPEWVPPVVLPAAQEPAKLPADAASPVPALIPDVGGAGADSMRAAELEREFHDAANAGSWRQAGVSARAAARLAPTDPLWSYRQALMAMELQDFVHAEQQLQETLERDERFVMAWYTWFILARASIRPPASPPWSASACARS